MNRFLRIQRVSDGWWFHIIDDSGVVWKPDIEDANQLETANLKVFFEFYKGDPFSDLRFRWYRRGLTKAQKSTASALDSLGRTIDFLRAEIASQEEQNEALTREYNDLLVKLNARSDRG